MTNEEKELLDIIKEDTMPALGCTEPIAVCYLGAFLKKYIKDDIAKANEIDVVVSKNIYKNGKSVTIPNTGTCGLDLAAVLGLSGGNKDDGLLVLTKFTDEMIARAKELRETLNIKLSYDEDTPDIYVKMSVKFDDMTVEGLLQKGHTNVEYIKVDDEVLYENKLDEAKDDVKEFMSKLTLKKIKELVLSTPMEELGFIEEGVEMNMHAANEGLKLKNSKLLGQSLEEIQNKKILCNDAYTRTRILTAAAADMRMSGGNCMVMTSGGSGNQGINVIIPIYLIYEEFNLKKEDMIRAIYFGHAINRFVKTFSGKLSGMCGCAIAAGLGAAAGITMMMGGTDEQIEGACSNMFANLTGLICDGAKNTCSLKLSTCAGEAVLSAFLALNGCTPKENVGVVSGTIEDTIKNVGLLCRSAFNRVDDVMLEIIK